MSHTPQRPELNALFNLPPQDAIDYLKNKGYKIGWDWHETLDNAHSRAFTVAKVARVDVLQDIKGSLIYALENGQSFEKWKADITPVLQEKGWWGKKTVVNLEGKEQEVQLGSSRRLRTIYDTNMQSAFSAGRYKAMLASSATRPYWEWRHVTIKNPRKQHVALDGRIFRFDDGFWSVAFPPSEWGCKCRVIARSARDVEDKEILDSDGHSTEVYERVSTDRKTGANVNVKRTQFNIPTKDGTLTFAPAAGFNGSPASSHLIDKVLTDRATKLAGETQALFKQVEAAFTTPARLKAHQAFIDNTLSFKQSQKQTSTIGLLKPQQLTFLRNKQQASISPIILMSDALLLKKEQNLTVKEWHTLPVLLKDAEKSYWDSELEQIIFILPALQDQHVLKVSAKIQADYIQLIDALRLPMQLLELTQYDEIKQ